MTRTTHPPRATQSEAGADAHSTQHPRSVDPAPAETSVVHVPSIVPGHKAGEQCHGIKQDGGRCRSTTTSIRGYCFSHDPTISDERKQQVRTRGAHTPRARGARSRARELVPSRLLPAVDRMEKAMVDVEEGRLAPARGQAMASMMNSLVKAFQAGEVEARLREMEQAIKANPVEMIDVTVEDEPIEGEFRVIETEVDGQ